MQKKLYQIFIVIIFGLGSFLFSSCDRSEPSKPVSSVQDEKDGAAEAYKTFSQIRRSKPIDFAMLTKKYNGDLKNYVQAADRRYGSNLNSKITEALQNGLRGWNPNGNAQYAEKYIQYAFYLTYVKSMQELTEGTETQELLDRMNHAFPVIYSTVLRRSKWAGREDELGIIFSEMNREIKETAVSGDISGLDRQVDNMDSFLNGIYVLSVLYELEGLENSRDSNVELVDEKIAESRIYYLIISTAHKDKNPGGEKAVTAMIEREPSEVDIDLIRSILKNDFKSQISLLSPRHAE